MFAIINKSQKAVLKIIHIMYKGAEFMAWDINYTKMIGEALFKLRPAAVAKIEGSLKYPNIRGTVSFYNAAGGSVVAAQIYGLPNAFNACDNRIFAMHIHEGESCTDNAKDPFADVMGHYNPYNCPHPAHAGDLPPLFENIGYAWNAVYTDRFKINEVIGRSVIIHSRPDDFTSQPSGNAGEKIACGEIKQA